MTEGRRAFLRRVSGIERGADCARYEPLLSALADGEASAEDLALLRPHMQTCLSCRAAMRAFRAMPERVASVLPPAALVAADGGGPLRALIESVVGAAQHKTAAMGERLHAAAELATGQKVAAVAASAAALAGGGTAVDQFADHQGPPQQPAEQVDAHPIKKEAAAEPAPAPSAQPIAGEQPPVPEPAPAPTPEPPPPPPPDPANEFPPAASAPAAAASPEPRPAQPAGGEFTSGAAGGGGGAGEFAP